MAQSPYGPGFFVHGILQATILEWKPRCPPGDLPNPGIKPASLTFPASAGRLFTTSATWEASPISLLLLLSCFSRVRLCATAWTAAYQAPLSMGFSRQEYWSRVPLPSPSYLFKAVQIMLSIFFLIFLEFASSQLHVTYLICLADF